MERCEGYYRLENRRCDRSATRDVRAADGHFYLVCEYHARQTWSASVARWNGQSLSSGQLAKVYGFTDLDGSQPDAWRYVIEVQDAGKPADVTGYR